MDLTPPESMRSAARDGLRRHERGESGDGLRPKTVARANRIAAGEELTPEHVREMAAWFARHGTNRQEPGTPWYAAWQLWGGNAGREWSQRKVRQMDETEETEETKADTPEADKPAEVDEPADTPPEPLDTAFGEAVKALPGQPWRVLTRGIVWGGRDLVGDTFVRGGTDLGAARAFEGMPVYYDHAQGGIKSQIGSVVAAEEDDEGITFEVELDRSKRYVADVLALVNAGALGSSTGALSHTVVRQGGTLKRWIIGELSLTPTPAEPRTHPAIKAVDDTPAPIVEAVQDETLEDTTMGDTQPNPTPDLGGEIAQLSEAVKSLGATVTAVRSDLDEIRSMPAVKAKSPEELGGAIGGGLQQRAAEYEASGQYHHLKSMRTISRAGSPAKQDRYPEGVLGGFCKALWYAQTNISDSRDARKALEDVYGADPHNEAAKALGTQAGVSGAYMIPEQFIPQLMAIAAQNDALYGRTMVIPADGGEIVIPALDHSGAWVDGQSNYFGGVTVTWGDDDASTVETQPTFKQIRLKTNAIKARTRVKNSLMMRSAITIDAVISNLLGNAIGRARDWALMRGNGTAKPLGFLNAPATIDAGGSAIDFATLAGMEDDVIPERDANYVWAIHTKSRSAIYALQQTNNSLVTFLPDLRGKPQAVLLGRPIVWTDKLPFLSGDVSNRVNLIDPSMIVCAEYQGIAIAISDQVRFEDDETVIRAIMSMDAQPWLSSKVEIASGEYVSGFITI